MQNNNLQVEVGDLIQTKQMIGYIFNIEDDVISIKWINACGNYTNPYPVWDVVFYVEHEDATHWTLIKKTP